MRRPVIWILCILGFGAIVHADRTAAAVVLVGGITVVCLIRFRGRGVFRIAAASVTIGLTLIGLVAALAVPKYRAGLDPLLVATTSHDARFKVSATGIDFSGFVVSDNDNATNSVDAQAPFLTTVIATGGETASDGTFDYAGVQNALIHAHLAGARGELVVRNYDPNAGAGGDFTAALAHAALATPHQVRAYAAAVAAVVSSEHWDGVVVDFENVAPVDQPGLLALLRSLRKDLPAGTTLSASVPTDAATQGYDLKAIAGAVDVVDLMTYDEHTSSTKSPGPVSSLSWIRGQATAALAEVPASKLQLGDAAYGYAWGPSAAALGNSFSPAQARAFVQAKGVTPTWDPAAAEWTAHLADGTVLWWADGRSVTAVAALARTLGLEGAAVWELSAADPIEPTSATVPIQRATVHPDTSRPIQRVSSTGLVALTFDDGPDPTWTPQILDVLTAKGVPATFFDIGMNAEANPDLVSREVADGNVIGDHTYSHLDLTTIPLWRAKLEIAAGQWVLHGITGLTPTLFRSPYGASELADTNTDAHKDLATELGMQPVGWNVDPEDWQLPGVSTIVQRATASSGDNLVILLHDGGGDRSQTVAALPSIIDNLRARGYTFVTVDQLDGSLSAPYAAPDTSPLGTGMALASIASFRLWSSAHTVVIWAMIALGLLSILRIVASWPLAVVHRRRSRRVRRSGPERDLSVAVIIPAHNEEATIAKTIASVAALRGPVREVIVAENGSTDATADVVRQVAAEHPELPLRIATSAAAGKAAALNACLATLESDVIVVIDADTVVDPEFVERILPHFDDPDVGAVAGNVKVGNRRGLLPRLQSLEYIMSLALDRRAQAQLNVVSVVPGAAGSFRRESVVRAGGWPSRTLTEDTDLTIQLLSAGWKVPYESEAITWTEAPNNVDDVLRQRRRWSYGAAQVSSINGRRMLDTREGRVGLLALPWLFIAQVALPAAGPLVDAFLIWMILNGDWKVATGMLVLALGSELALAAWALRSDRESLRQLWLVPLARVVWRPLLLFAVAGSLTSGLMGHSVHWRQLRRTNTVTPHPGPESAAGRPHSGQAKR